jgi:hypothetical protein
VAADPDGGAYVALGAFDSATRLVHLTPSCDTEDLFDPGFPPGDLALVTDGTLFVIDPGGNRVVHFNRSDGKLDSWTLPGHEPPLVLASHPDGTLLVGAAHTVFKYDASGTLLTSWGTAETFAAISGIAVNALGDVYVSDRGNKRIRMYGVRQPTDNPPLPPVPPPPPPPPPYHPPPTAHPPAVLLHIGDLTAPNACLGPSSITTIVTAKAPSLDGLRHDFVYLIASPGLNYQYVCGVQVGIQYDRAGDNGTGLEILSWHACSDLEFPGDDWPGSGSGNTMTWAENVSTDIVVAGYFEVISHGASRMWVTPWPVTDLAKIAGCGGGEYALQVPPDQLGWISWGNAGFGTDSDGCNPALGPCQFAPTATQPSSWGRIKTLYAH